MIWNSGRDDTELLRRLTQIRREVLPEHSAYEVRALPRDVLLATHEMTDGKLIGVFSVQGQASLVEVCRPDGSYENLITGDPVEVYAGRLSIDGTPIILKV